MNEHMDIGSKHQLSMMIFLEEAQPNSPLVPPLTQNPESRVVTQEIHTGSDDKHTLMKSIPEGETTASAKESVNQITTEDIAAPVIDESAKHVPHSEEIVVEETAPQGEDTADEPHVQTPQSVGVVAQVPQTEEELRRLVGRYKPNLEPKTLQPFRGTNRPKFPRNFF